MTDNPGYPHLAAHWRAILTDNYDSPDGRRSQDIGRNQELFSFTPQSITPFTDNHSYVLMSFLGRLARAITPTHHGTVR